MVAVLYLSNPMRRQTTLLVTAVGGAVYILVLLAIDKGTRNLFRNALQILQARINRQPETQAGTKEAAQP